MFLNKKWTAVLINDAFNNTWEFSAVSFGFPYLLVLDSVHLLDWEMDTFMCASQPLGLIKCVFVLKDIIFSLLWGCTRLGFHPELAYLSLFNFDLRTV